MLKRNLIYILLILLISCSNQPKLKPLQANSVILAFGDSLTFGTGASPKQSYPNVLSRLIGYTVINAGQPGEETKEAVVRIHRVLQLYHPKLVIICLGGNDMLRRRDPESIKLNLAHIIRTIQGKGIEVILIAVPQPKLSMKVPDFYSDLGSEFNVPVEKNTLSRLMSDSKFKSDYIHLNDAGYQQLAEALAKFLQTQGAIK